MVLSKLSQSFIEIIRSRHGNRQTNTLEVLEYVKIKYIITTYNIQKSI